MPPRPAVMHPDQIDMPIPTEAQVEDLRQESENIQAQYNAAQANVQNVRNQIAQLEENRANATDDAEISQITSQIEALQGELPGLEEQCEQLRLASMGYDSAYQQALSAYESCSW